MHCFDILGNWDEKTTTNNSRMNQEREKVGLITAVQQLDRSRYGTLDWQTEQG